MNNNNFMVFSGTASRYLAEKICQELGCPLGNLSVTRFADGEFEVCYEDSIRGRDVFLVQSTFPSSDNLMELLLMIDAAKRASARSICAVVPYFGWARQDRKSKPRVSIGAKLVADLLSVAGIDRLMTMDLHADQEQGFFNVPVDHLYASTVMLPYIKSLNLPNLCIATPDVGGSKRAASYAKYLDCPAAFHPFLHQPFRCNLSGGVIGIAYNHQVGFRCDRIPEGFGNGKATCLLEIEEFLRIEFIGCLAGHVKYDPTGEADSLNVPFV